MINPPIVFVLDQNGNKTSQESAESVGARLRVYDECEKYDIAFSCLAIEGLIYIFYRETVNTRCSNNKYFDELPGKIYFMMVLSVCNTSASIDIESATSKLKKSR